MKNSPAVFLTSLAVSAISLTVPMPAATTVLDLFIGEDIAVYVQDKTQPACKTRQHTNLEAERNPHPEAYNRSSSWERMQLLRELDYKTTLSADEVEAAFPLTSHNNSPSKRTKRVILNTSEG